MLVAIEFEILRDVEANGRKDVALARMPVRVATLIHEPLFSAMGNALVHNRTVFLEDRYHDWDWKDGNFRYYSRVAEAADVVVVYEVLDDTKLKPAILAQQFGQDHAVHEQGEPEVQALIQECLDLAIVVAGDSDTFDNRVKAVQDYLARLHTQRAESLSPHHWSLALYQWLAKSKAFATLSVLRALK